MAKKIKPKNLYRLLALLLTLAIFAFGFLRLTARPAEAAWFDESWGYRTQYAIGNTGAAVTNQKVKFDIDTATLITNNKLQSDCGDSRFTDGSGAILKY